MDLHSRERLHPLQILLHVIGEMKFGKQGVHVIGGMIIVSAAGPQCHVHHAPTKAVEHACVDSQESV